MAVRTFAVAGFTTEAVADTVNMTNAKFMALQGGSTTQRTKILGVYAAGLETSTSSPQKLLLSFDSQVGGTLTALGTGESDTEDDPATAALAAPVKTFTTVTSGNQPQRAKKYLASCAFNAIGGVMNRQFPYGREPSMLGNAANAGEVSLSGFTGTTPGALSGEIKFETL